MEVWDNVEGVVATCFLGSARRLSQISLPWLRKILDLAKFFQNINAEQTLYFNPQWPLQEDTNNLSFSAILTL